jgi:hypothetical protein
VSIGRFAVRGLREKYGIPLALADDDAPHIADVFGSAHRDAEAIDHARFFPNGFPQ